MKRIPTLLMLAALSLTARTRGSAQAATIATTKFDPSLKVNLALCKKLPSGLYYRDLVVGKGAVVKQGTNVFVFYDGRFPDGKQFDSRKTGQPPLDFPVGAARVISGWDEGVAGMHVGGKRQLIIPPALGYGAQGMGKIPPNSILVFTVEVVKVQ